MEKDIEYRIKRFLDECEDGNWYWDDGVDAIENLIKGYRELDKDNNDLRRLYRRTAVKLKEKGHEEVAGYFLAQINEVPTFTIEDDIDYYAEYYKMKTKIRELEKCLEVTSKSLNNVAYDQIP